MKPIKQVIDEIESANAERLKAPFCMKTGFKSLDQDITGYRKGDLVVVGGRPGMGKTAFFLSTVLQFINDDETKMLFFSNQICMEQIVIRLKSLLSGINLYKVRSGKLNKQELLKKKMADKALSMVKNLYLDDSIELSGSYLEKGIREAAKSPGRLLIFIDVFSQVLKKDCFFDGCEEEFPDVEYVSKRIKRLAKETGAVFILGVNLIRDEDELVVRIPALEQLGENRGILNLAHKVFLLYRDAYYEREFKSDRFQIQIAKNTAGKTGYCNLSFNEQTGLIEEPKNV